MTSNSGKITLRDNEAAQQYEVYVDGELVGYAGYRPLENARELPHTEMNSQYMGQGLGSKLVQFALDDLRKRGLNVVPTCPFIADYIGKHPEYQDLVQG
ncbi:GNAT family N-acetyltransferase [Deinococcus sp. AJ005]|uniref:GNAT family N-acetyltransferase n=1 Tax=Deinococcus sp. AJ005 TaxID=2652443 RepID=UPI00125CA8F6|nr:GNAT family N-acetyltransferase [Deinococcus sp. AJ005]QFP77071.1 N-acetyltransferase [Deinococcus sp. AJ005]